MLYYAMLKCRWLEAAAAAAGLGRAPHGGRERRKTNALVCRGEKLVPRYGCLGLQRRKTNALVWMPWSAEAKD